MCLSPEGFAPWRRSIQKALTLGVRVNMVIPDYEKIKAAPFGQTYLQSICPWGIESAEESASRNAIYFINWCSPQVYNGEGAAFRFWRCRYPHTFLGFLCDPSDATQKGWGVIDPYLPCVEGDMGNNFGLLFEDNGTPASVYSKFRISVCKYFEFVESNGERLA